jgi:hypothetical protein
MASQVIIVDTPVTRFAQSFVNLTQINSTKYPATTSMQIDSTMNVPLTSYYIYDQYAFRTIAVSGVPMP